MTLCQQTPMRILAEIHPPQAIRAILRCLDIPTRAPPVAAAVEQEAEPLATDADPFIDDDF